jgi:hypothetical protein
MLGRALCRAGAGVTEFSGVPAWDPKTGIYVSTKNPPGIRYVVESVIELNDAPNQQENFFTVNLIEETGTEDMSETGV